jgi:hypothetical protein
MPTAFQTLKKNTLVQTTGPYQGRVRLGVLLESSRGKVTVLLDDGVSVISGPAERFVPSVEPLPPALEQRHAVGDAVVFTDEFGNEQIGVVKSVSLGSAKVVCDKGRSVVESFPAKFSKTERTLTPAGVHPAVAPFRVRIFKEQAGHGDGPAFVAVIQKYGVDSFRVVADGWGGPCECQPMDLRDPSAPHKFEEAVQEWCKAAGAPDNFYGVESWIEWSRNFQPYALEAAEYFAGEIRTK